MATNSIRDHTFLVDPVGTAVKTARKSTQIRKTGLLPEKRMSNEGISSDERITVRGVGIRCRSICLSHGCAPICRDLGDCLCSKTNVWTAKCPYVNELVMVMIMLSVWLILRGETNWPSQRGDHHNCRNARQCSGFQVASPHSSSPQNLYGLFAGCEDSDTIVLAIHSAVQHSQPESLSRKNNSSLLES